MPGTPPNGKPWLSSTWREYVLQLGSELQAIQQYMPLIEYAIHNGGGGLMKYRAFPAVIEFGNSFDSQGCNYVAVEVAGPRGIPATIQVPQDAKDDSPGSYKFVASNTYEENLVCESGKPIVIPPATIPECFQGLECQAQPICSGGEGHIVTMNAAVCAEFEASKGDEGESEELVCSQCMQTDRLLGPNTFYWFSAVVQPCLYCGEDEGDGGGTEPLTSVPFDITPLPGNEAYSQTRTPRNY
tara:strand:- start:799 stop:1524 length:726 start_codon:yes stop_codon:yes gene_type:complete